MKHLSMVVALMAGLSACAGQSENDATNLGQNTEAAGATILADLGEEPTGPIYTENKGDTLALSGYDAVSYFEGPMPMEGKKEFTLRYQGYDYRFSSIQNAQKFQANPAMYVPQYGGHCAWAIGANDALAPGDPMVYKIVDGKLYLNFNKSVAERWNKDVPSFISKANKNYPTHDASEHYATN